MSGEAERWALRAVLGAGGAPAPPPESDAGLAWGVPPAPPPQRARQTGGAWLVIAVAVAVALALALAG